jgi:hypothetical protein
VKHLNWAVFVDTHDEERWRETLGQPDIDAWCAAHGWKSEDVASGTVNVYSYRGGITEVTAELIERDTQGLPTVDDQALRRRTVCNILRRSLPEGIGTVIR